MSCCWHWPQYIRMSGLAIRFNNLFDLYLNHYRRISQCWHLKDSLEVSGWLHSWFCLLERDSVWCGRILCLAGDCSPTSWPEGHNHREASVLWCWYLGRDSACPGRVSFSSQWTSWWRLRRSQQWAMARLCFVCPVTLPSLTLKIWKIKKIGFIIRLRTTQSLVPLLFEQKKLMMSLFEFLHKDILTSDGKEQLEL